MADVKPRASRPLWLSDNLTDGGARLSELGESRPKDVARLLARLEKNQETGCMEWTGAKDRKGYGKMYFMGRSRYVARIAWMLFSDEDPSGLCVMHKCDNPSCANPLHLGIGTTHDNIADKVSKCRQQRGSMCYNAKLTEDQARAIRVAYAAGGVSHNGLAALYNVSKDTIADITKGKQWKEIPGHGRVVPLELVESVAKAHKEMHESTSSEQYEGRYKALGAAIRASIEGAL